MTIWQALTALLALPVTGQIVVWLRTLTADSTRARAKARDAAAKLEAGKAAALAKAEADRAQQLADLHAEMRAHRVTRDAEILSLAVECAKLREDAQADRETAQAFELQAVRDRGTIQRLSEERDRLRIDLEACRRLTRRSDPFGGG